MTKPEKPKSRAKELAEAADAHAEWMASEDWRGPAGADDEVKAALDAVQEPQPEARATSAPRREPSPAFGHASRGMDAPPQEAALHRAVDALVQAAIDLQARQPAAVPMEGQMAELARELHELRAEMAWLREHHTVAGDDAPRWLLVAAGDPKTYDMRDPARCGVGWRVHPRTVALVKQVQAELRLRTLAGTLELVLRLGCAAAMRLPAR